MINIKLNTILNLEEKIIFLSSKNLHPKNSQYNLIKKNQKDHFYKKKKSCQISNSNYNRPIHLASPSAHQFHSAFDSDLQLNYSNEW